MCGSIKIADKKPDAKNRSSAHRVRKAEHSQSRNSHVEHVLFLQRTLGNQAVQRLMKSGALWAKLRLGMPGNIYEQEADRVAEQVMRMPETEVLKNARVSSRNRDIAVQRRCSKCKDKLKKEEEKPLRAKKAPGYSAEVTPGLERPINSLRGGGRSLSDSVRTFFEPRFRCDFRQVRVHTDARAGELARAVNAKAFTLGNDIVFDSAQYNPETATGKSLLAHELVHVVQQASIPNHRTVPDEATGREAGTNSLHIAADIGRQMNAYISGNVLQREGRAEGSATFGGTTEEKMGDVKSTTEASLKLKVPILPGGKIGRISLLEDADLKLNLADKRTLLAPDNPAFKAQLDIALTLAQLELLKHDFGSSGKLSSGLKLSGSAEGSTSTTEGETGSLGGKLDVTALKYTLPPLSGRYGALGGELSLSGSAGGKFPLEGDATGSIGAKLGGSLEYTSPRLPYYPYGPSGALSYGQLKLGASGSLSADYETTGKSKLGAGLGFSAGYEWTKLYGIQPFVTLQVDLKWTQSGDKVESSQITTIKFGGKF